MLNYNEFCKLLEGSIQIKGDRIKSFLFDKGMRDNFSQSLIPLLIKLYKEYKIYSNNISDFFQDLIITTNEWLINHNIQENKNPFIIHLTNHTNINNIYKLHEYYLDFINKFNELLYNSLNEILNEFNEQLLISIPVSLEEICKENVSSYFYGDDNINKIIICYEQSFKELEIKWKDNLDNRFNKRKTNQINDNIDIIYELFADELLGLFYATIYDSIIHEYTHYNQSKNIKSNINFNNADINGLDYINHHFEIGATITYFYNIINDILKYKSLKDLNIIFKEHKISNLVILMDNNLKKVYLPNWKKYFQRYKNLNSDSKRKFWKNLYDLVYNK